MSLEDDKLENREGNKSKACAKMGRLKCPLSSDLLPVCHGSPWLLFPPEMVHLCFLMPSSGRGISVHRACNLQGPPNAHQLPAYISITCDPITPIPGGPGPLSQNLERMRVGWRNTKFQFQVWQSLDKSKMFGLKSQPHHFPPTLHKPTLQIFLSITTGMALTASTGFLSLGALDILYWTVLCCGKLSYALQGV